MNDREATEISDGADLTDLQRKRRSTLQRERQREMQQDVAWRLILGGLLFALLTIGAVWLLLIPRGKLTIAAVEPVLDRYMIAGMNDSPLAAHSLFSVSGLARTSLADIDRRFADRSLYADYDQLSVVGFEVFPTGEARVTHRAQVRAWVTYLGDEGRSSQLDAQLELSERDWRILDISVKPASP